MQYKEAYIMEIERFAIHDGPGIRTTVFLQGCPLRCPWCANPESQSIGAHLMYQQQKCAHCLKCMNSCPQHAISFDGKNLVFDRNKCVSCRTCEKNCLNSAIKFIGEKKTTDEIFKVIEKDETYYQESNGGVTFSGGEPFVQFEALKQLLQMCHEKYHTAIETTGDTNWENIEEVLPYVDLFLLDVKHYDPNWITEVTKGNGNRIQSNFKKLAEVAADKIIARIPVILQYNYEQDTLEKMLQMIKENNIKRVNLLPYHTLGIDKYTQLGRNYTLSSKMLTKKDLEPYRLFGKSIGLEVE